MKWTGRSNIKPVSQKGKSFFKCYNYKLFKKQYIGQSYCFVNNNRSGGCLFGDQIISP